ncbi:hypothetical protein L209DRAFT_752981 [Thermothelomyces heterothallicus CBS 203.75]
MYATSPLSSFPTARTTSTLPDFRAFNALHRANLKLGADIYGYLFLLTAIYSSVCWRNNP